ncbi:hypothetical protein [Singulisphaera acidiphila]|uniref:Uncharacterized protein n=1 Tax=Singulisphaera acidiphila (strain ATCC BAA-1392 / DSM 18658 / VKM B-2454 / MOB10) TaxID=886293 RepID=L0DBU7_SINAD|nr:hypothetical protein [Singulisphaera acidiphila]AGA26330.1 hypothetical protein Sinac_1974 [Singulisphaera acidiphila DSM 18658]
MPLRLNVGVSKKLGLPEYSSIGASCNLELEVDSMLIHTDLDGLHEQIRGAFVAARQAVNDELARLQTQAPPAVAPHAGAANRPTQGSGALTNESQARSNGARVGTNGPRSRSAKPSTANQVRAIVAIAQRQHADLEGLLRDEYHVDRPEDLSLNQASAFIDQLKIASDV